MGAHQFELLAGEPRRRRGGVDLTHGRPSSQT
jgi:hypothetical protein